ncbi:hypothetical protein B0T10DRAFT_559511 [Thelonectria olida]|uniref:MARVEL domain-containing protein n=1 Tax=Thelonectria olida TaxID=1576542 RepID=A0A9P8WAI5_9HYPO|nr:hypothetical protein B0T10DRAFT_559511 [Thelonectria olida]
MVGRRPDVLEYPTGFTVLHIFQAIFSVITTILVAFTVNVLAFAGNCIMLATAVLTFLVSMWMVVSHISMAHLYNFWAALWFDVLLLISWITSVAVLLFQTRLFWGDRSGHCDEVACTGSAGDAATVWGYVFLSAAGLGVVEILFFCVSLIFHCVMNRRYHRYNQVGRNLEAEPVQISKHPQVSTEYKTYHSLP